MKALAPVEMVEVTAWADCVQQGVTLHLNARVILQIVKLGQSSCFMQCSGQKGTQSVFYS